MMNDLTATYRRERVALCALSNQQVLTTARVTARHMGGSLFLNDWHQLS